MSTPCPYCMEQIPEAATRCSHCAGELRFCPTCRSNVGVVEKKKPLTLVYRKTVFRCLRCGRKLGDSRVHA